MVEFVYDKCVVEIVENMPLNPTTLVNAYSYEYAYRGQVGNFTNYTYCSYGDGQQACYKTRQCSFGFSSPYIESGCGCQYITVSNCYAGARQCFANDCHTLYVGDNTSFDLVSDSYNWMTGRYKLLNMFSSCTWTTGCVYCHIVDFRVMNCWQFGSTDKFTCFCNCVNVCLDGSMIWSCCYVTPVWFCNHLCSKCCDCHEYLCIEIKKLTGDCYEFCLNGVSCFCKPLCSLNKMCILCMCNKYTSTGVAYLTNIISIIPVCTCTNDTNVCVFYSSPGVYAYFCIDQANSNINSSLVYKADVVAVYDNGQSGFGIPAYVCNTYCCLTPSTWNVTCEGADYRSSIPLIGGQKMLVKVLIPHYGCGYLHDWTCYCQCPGCCCIYGCTVNFKGVTCCCYAIGTSQSYCCLMACPLWWCKRVAYLAYC